jgi:hypothetical protein
LELSKVQLSGTKEALDDPPENKSHSKRAQTTPEINAFTNE